MGAAAGAVGDNGAVSQPTVAAHPIDATDRRILRLLTRTARASYRDIGVEVGLSANAVAQRMRRMEEAGVIRGYTVLLDPGLDGATLNAVVHLRTAVDVDLVSMEQQIWSTPAVSELLDLAGSIDYEVRLRARTQAEIYHAVNQLRALPGVTDIETRPVLRSVPRPSRRRQPE